MSLLEDHLHDTYQYLFDVAHEGLKANISFLPVGAAVRKTGEQIRTQLDLDWRSSAPQDHISGLLAAFRKDDKVSGLMAVGLVFDAAAGADRLDERALVFHLEAANGRALQVVVPYARLAEGLAFAEPQLSEIPAEVFTSVLPE
ncbi:MAG: hypothetical protein KGS44_01590 [Alphaproteobacteria bacterium]|jgi:hypothetical protein|nr:hypothetical protein [Alphaproteobacteria bacterium]